MHFRELQLVHSFQTSSTGTCISEIFDWHNSSTENVDALFLQLLSLPAATQKLPVAVFLQLAQQ
jgi:hypothetical protein